MQAAGILVAEGPGVKDALLGSIGLGPQRLQAVGVLCDGLCQPLLTPVKRGGQGVAVSLLPPGLLDDLIYFVGSVDLFRRKSDHYLAGMTLQRRDDPGCCHRVLEGLQCQKQLGFLEKFFGVGRAAFAGELP